MNMQYICPASMTDIRLNFLTIHIKQIVLETSLNTVKEPPSTVHQNIF